MKGRRLTILLAAMAIVSPLVLYVVGYFLLAQRDVGISGGGVTSWSPRYSAGLSMNPTINRIFRPIHIVDRTWIRPAMWREEYGMSVELHSFAERVPPKIESAP